MSKDFFAEHFANIRKINTNKVDIERHAFGDNVRGMCEILTGVNRGVTHKTGEPFYNNVYNYTQEEKNLFIPSYNLTIGEILQLAGTDGLRNNFNEDVWLISLFDNQIKKAQTRGNIVIICDVRFPNEADRILDEGGVLFRMEGDPLGIRAKSKRDLTHISETSLDYYNFFTKIINNQTPGVESLRKQIINIQKEYQF